MSLVVSLILTAQLPVWAAEQDRERLLAETIKATVRAEQLVELKTADGSFIGLETKADPERLKGALLLLHDAGGNPDEPGLMHDLRGGLVEHGWTTLAIQLPVLDVQQPLAEHLALIAQAGARIDAAQTWLESGEYPTIAIIGHGLGALMAAQTLAKQGDQSPWKAFVSLSQMVPKSDLAEADTLAHLKAIQIPMLDIYGTRDLHSVTDSAKQRRLAAKTIERTYRQSPVTGANHDYTGLHPALMQQINAWLTQTLKR